MKKNLNLNLKKLKKDLLLVEESIKKLKEDVDLWENDFIDFLDENYPEVEILGNTYGVAWALKKLDRIAYYEELNNWCDEYIDEQAIMQYDSDLILTRDQLQVQIEDLENEIENLKD